METTKDDLVGKIIPPKEQEEVFSGKWRDVNNFDSELQFFNKGVSFNGDIWRDVYYKIKRVDKEGYLKTKYLADKNPITIEADKNEVDVVTLYSSENFLGEFLIINENSLVFFIQDNLIEFEKISDDPDPSIDVATKGGDPLSDNQNTPFSGVLLGIRTPDVGGYKYRTLWLSNDGDGLLPHLYADNLFFPRTSGFWELKTGKQGQGGEEILRAKNIAIKEGTSDEGVYISALNKRIDYISNDFISLETGEEEFAKLQILPIDNLLSETGLRISDILGDQGIDLVNSTRDKIAGLNGGGSKIILDESFGIVREMGRWSIKGRVYYKREGQFENQSIDLDLNIPAPNKIIFYDTLVPSWFKIKDRVPDAIDAFTSPNRDMAIIRTKGRLLIYKISPGQLGRKPLGEIPFEEGAEIVMAEWATGSYVKNWRQAFKEYGAKLLDF